MRRHFCNQKGGNKFLCLQSSTKIPVIVRDRTNHWTRDDPRQRIELSIGIAAVIIHAVFALVYDPSRHVTSCFKPGGSISWNRADSNDANNRGKCELHFPSLQSNNYVSMEMRKMGKDGVTLQANNSFCLQFCKRVL